MSDKKDEHDNWSGVPGFVQDNWGKQKREAARKKKLANSKKKTSDRDGKGKR